MDFLKKAMDTVNDSSSDDQGKQEPSPAAKPGTETDQTSPTDHLASAKVLAGAAQSTLRHENIDKSKVADAADDVIHAASQYGKLDEKGYGQYVEKAETYIHKYKGDGTPTDAPAAPPAESS